MGLVSKAEFSNLSINEKANLVFNHGEYIAVRHYYQQYINLYLFNDYFVEVWYHPYDNQILKIELLENDKTLSLYIDYMNKLNNK